MARRESFDFNQTHNKIDSTQSPRKYSNDFVWHYSKYYLCKNGADNIDKRCVVSLTQDELAQLLEAIKNNMKCDSCSSKERRTQLLDDMSHWRSLCKSGNKRENNYNYRCGYVHSCDTAIMFGIRRHYESYPSYIPSGRKTKLYNASLDIGGSNKDNYASNEDELRTLPSNHRKIFTWLHIRIVTDLRLSCNVV